jgi:hypothetical protein
MSVDGGKTDLTLKRRHVCAGHPMRLVLNQRGIMSDLGRPWTRASIHQILTNEKYIGNNIFNRVSYKLKQRRIVNQRDTWVRADGVFPSIVDRALFERARAIINGNGLYPFRVAL